jgi:hypothetical protein
MLKRPEAAPASIGGIPTIAIAEIGVMTIAWPSALRRSGAWAAGTAMTMHGVDEGRAPMCYNLHIIVRLFLQWTATPRA